MMLLIVVLAACGSGDSPRGQAESGIATTATDGLGEQPADDTDDDIGPATTANEDGGAGTTTSADSTDSGDDTTTAPAIDGVVASYELGANDPPAGPVIGSLLAFNLEGAYRIEGETATKLIDGSISELSDDGAGGILFQRPGDEQVIWWLAEGETAPVDLLVTVDPIYLVLEGVSGRGAEHQIVYQRVARTGSPDTSHADLKAYRFSDAAVITLDVVGGWEAGTTITTVTDGLTTGIWGGEGYNAYYAFDLTSGSSIGNFPAEQWDDYLSLDAASDGTDLVAVGLVYDDAAGFFDEMGVYRVDLEGQLQANITAFPWDNGSWYPNGMFIDGGLAVISRNASPDFDPDQAPLGPLVVDLASGDSYTLPLAVSVRPVSS
ncbi:MAG: hypothetical protein GY939_16300 [Actinomycetia bacterium]|nr:hypothetical protein [Actinomycetes bacterium]